MADNKLYFHFTLGPVQVFVAQARRTRDFWAGSFLLSWVASVAMQEVKAQGGEVKFPLPDDSYLDHLTGAATDWEKAPKQGSIPNRFKALKAEVPADFDPEEVTQAVQKAWWELAELIWEEDFNWADANSQTREIWQRQVTGFWDMSWVLTKDEEASNLLDRRKNWRSYMAPKEPGVSCMMMDGWQELSGLAWPGAELNTFWKDLRKRNVIGLKTDLREQEYLCAIGWIKRRFARYFKELEGIDMGSWTLNGWQVPVNVPSVNYLAAAPWLAKVIEAVHEREGEDDHQKEITDRLLNIYEGVKRQEISYEGAFERLPRIQQGLNETRMPSKNWFDINGRFWFQDELQNLVSQDPENQILKNLLRVLQELQGPSVQLGQPSDFYSILLMDGDSLGSQMGAASKQEPISAALNNFTSKVPAVVQQYSGFLVYAGGDDVLALLSVDDALACADALRKLYNDCFVEQNRVLKEQSKTKPELAGVSITSSLSGALMYCHYKSPLAQNLAKAHPLLDKIAKDECGRDSLAIQVWKPGGLHCGWSSPWDVEEGNVNRVSEINQLVSTLIYERQSDDRIARKFFYKLDELIQTLGLDKEQSISADQVESLFRAAWLHTGNEIKDLPATLPKQLLDMTRSWKRKPGVVTGAFDVFEERRFNADALKLIHFLATELQQSPKGYTPPQHTANRMEQAQ